MIPGAQCSPGLPGALTEHGADNMPMAPDPSAWPSTPPGVPPSPGGAGGSAPRYRLLLAASWITYALAGCLATFLDHRPELPYPQNPWILITAAALVSSIPLIGIFRSAPRTWSRSAVVPMSFLALACVGVGSTVRGSLTPIRPGVYTAQMGAAPVTIDVANNAIELGGTCTGIGFDHAFGSWSVGIDAAVTTFHGHFNSDGSIDVVENGTTQLHATQQSSEFVAHAVDWSGCGADVTNIPILPAATATPIAVLHGPSFTFSLPDGYQLTSQSATEINLRGQLRNGPAGLVSATITFASTPDSGPIPTAPTMTIGGEHAGVMEAGKQERVSLRVDGHDRLREPHG